MNHDQGLSIFDQVEMGDVDLIMELDLESDELAELCFTACFYQYDDAGAWPAATKRSK